MRNADMLPATPSPGRLTSQELRGLGRGPACLAAPEQGRHTPRSRHHGRSQFCPSPGDLME